MQELIAQAEAYTTLEEVRAEAAGARAPKAVTSSFDPLCSTM